MEYEDYLAEDFIINESFLQYCRGNDKEAVMFWENWLNEHPHKFKEASKAKDFYSILNGGHNSQSLGNKREAFIKLLEKEGVIVDPEGEAKVVAMMSERKSPKKLFSLFRIAAAATVLIAIFVGGFLIYNKSQPNPVAETPLQEQNITQIVPGGDRATLTLSDGRIIILDSASNGDIAQQGGVKVIKLGGKLDYSAGNNSSEVLYNTITTPKGGQYQLELADGSKVWLNAASSLRFPTAFRGNERTVELTGEGYFEVAHNEKMPFHVKVNDMDVQVLGTHFNINSYGNEPSVKTTLLEGRVMIKKNDKQVYLNPGQQAKLQSGEDNIAVGYDVDVEEVVAWKNGRFLFNSANIESIMRQVERWYDVEVIYEKKITETFSGDLPRSENIDQLIKILEATGMVHMNINGKQIVIKP